MYQLHPVQNTPLALGPENKVREETMEISIKRFPNNDLSVFLRLNPYEIEDLTTILWECHTGQFIVPSQSQMKLLSELVNGLKERG